MGPPAADEPLPRDDDLRDLADAEDAIEHVRAIHERVRGKDHRGRAYSAGDPVLLRWVHALSLPLPGPLAGVAHGVGLAGTRAVRWGMAGVQPHPTPVTDPDQG